MSCEVGPGSLATTRTPSSDSATLAKHGSCRGEHLRDGLIDGRIHRAARGACVPSAAEAAGQHSRVRAPWPSALAQLRPCAVLAEHDHDLAGRTLAEEVA